MECHRTIKSKPLRSAAVGILRLCPLHCFRLWICGACFWFVKDRIAMASGACPPSVEIALGVGAVHPAICTPVGPPKLMTSHLKLGDELLIATTVAAGGLLAKI